MPLRKPFRTATGVIDHREGIIIVLEDRQGHAGFGEAAPLTHYAGGTVAEVARALPRTLAAVHDRPGAWDSTPARGGGARALRCGIETALADLASQHSGVCLAAWLGEQHGLSAANHVPVNGTLDADDPEEAAREARALVIRGFRTLKVKVGTGPEADRARVHAVRDAVGDGIALRIDANGAWTVLQAIAALDGLADLDIELCEQPVSHEPPTVLADLAAIRRHAVIPIAVDESCRSVAELNRVAEAEAADTVVIKPMATGLHEAARMAGRARELGIGVIVTTMFDTGIGAAAAAHVAALAGAPPAACGLATTDLLEDDLVDETLVIDRGELRLNRAPGLGVRCDVLALQRYATEAGGEITWS